MIFDLFDKCFLINLDSEPERLRKVSLRLEKMNIPFTRISATVASPHLSRNPTLGLRGCTLSHLAILKKAQAEGLSSVLIIEDDAIFRDDTVSRMASLSKNLKQLPWGIFYLGYDECHPERTWTAAPGIKTVSEGYQTHAYAVSAAAYGKVTPWLENCAERAVHPFDCFRCDVKKYASEILLSIQETGFSSVTYDFQDKRKFYFRSPGQFEEFQANCAELR